ncbi:hypothetical protein SESBI_00913 [Sesbania bispinosa]|nr:hypothetical protein SESBI_00913 [Sesbania bispinosa]
MAKFNVVQKQRRALIAEKKRQVHGDPSTGKLKEQKEALQNGLVSMEDVQMAVAEGETKDTNRSSGKIHLKKSLKLKQLKRKGKNKRKSDVPAADTSADAMVE